MKRIRIAYLIPEFPGQTHIFFWREMNAMKKLGIDVEVVSTRRPPLNIISHRWSNEAIERTTYLFPMSAADFGGALAALLLSGPGGWARCLCAVLRTRRARLGERLRILALILPGAKLGRLAGQKGWAHVHVHSCANSAYVGMFAHMLTGIGYSLTLHGPLSMYGSGQDVKWGHAQFGIAVSQKLRAEILDGLPAVNPAGVEVAPMGVDLGVFSRTRPYQAAAEGSVARIVTCGRLHPGKGHQDLIEAIKILKNKGKAVHLTVLGEGPARGMLEARIRELGLKSEVELAGAVAEEVVRDRLEEANVFALASHDEAIGVATMEAMAMELPVVVTDVGGVRELVREGIDGVFVPASDPNAMAEGIAKVLRNPELARRMGISAGERVKLSFSSEVSARVIARRLGFAPVKVS